MDEPVINPAATRSFPPRNEFSEEGYLLLHPDVAIAVCSGIVDTGWQHFTLHGFAEGRKWVSRKDPLIGVSREVSPGDEMLVENETHYFDVGESALHCIETALFAARREKNSVQTILDLPCGHGRVMRFLKKAFPEARLTACDLNRDGVDYCAKVFGATPVISEVDPRGIPLAEEFDLIWCGSLLTHLSEEHCASFFRLFQRVLRPGGILVFTSHGRHSESELVAGKHRYGLNDSQIAELLAIYRQRGFAYVDYASDPGYGISLARPSYIMEHFVEPSGWQLIGYHEKGWDKRQDVISLQKQFAEISKNTKSP